MTCDMRHLTYYFFFTILSVSVPFGLGATIRTRREIHCLPYGGLLWIIMIKLCIVLQGIIILEELILSIPLYGRDKKSQYPNISVYLWVITLLYDFP